MTKPIQHLITTIGILLCLPSLAFSETYYDCNGPDRTMTYRSEPCHKGEWEIQRHEVDLSIYDNKNKEWVGSQNGGPLELYADEHGQFSTAGSINGHQLTFAVDTGASYLSISTAKAAEYGVSECKQQTNISTANGISNACFATAKELTFGGYQLHDVQILIAPNTPPLLGMNILKNFRVDTSNSGMRISKQ